MTETDSARVQAEPARYRGPSPSPIDATESWLLLLVPVLICLALLVYMVVTS